MPRRNSRRRKPAQVFLNLPYDSKFEPLYLAYIVGISAFGLVPRATLELPARDLSTLASEIADREILGVPTS